MPGNLPRFRIEVVSGPGKGASVDGRADASLRIGRAADNDFVIGDDRTVSKHHAEVVPEAGAYRIRDRKSANGVKRDGERLPDEGGVLRDGDELQLGRTKLRFRLLAEAPEPEHAMPKQATHQSPALESPPLRPEWRPDPDRPVEPPPGASKPARPPRTALPVVGTLGSIELFDQVVEVGGQSRTVGQDVRLAQRVEVLRIPSKDFGWFRRKSFLRAVEARVGLDHPNLQAPLASGQAGSEVFVVFPHRPGVSVYQVLRDCPRDVEVALAARIGCAVSGALAQIERVLGHEARVDVQEHTVRLCSDGTVMLCDSGLPQPSGRAQERSRFAAPEEDAGGQGGTSAAMFGLGVLLWELLAGDRIEVAQKTRLPSMDTVRLEVPPSFARTIRRATEVAPVDRFASAGQLEEALAEELQALGGFEADRLVAWLAKCFPDRPC